VHDIGLTVVRNDAGEIGFKFMAGGGMGRTPILGSVIRDFLPWQHLLTYTEAVMRVYNNHGRRDNKYKARIKILLKALGVEEFTRQVEAEWADLKDGPETLTTEEMERVIDWFQPHAYKQLDDSDVAQARRPATRPSPTGSTATSSRTRCRATLPWCCR
jgi:sulfite reductase (NADPH) hemoprotein beta-component